VPVSARECVSTSWVVRRAAANNVGGTNQREKLKSKRERLLEPRDIFSFDSIPQLGLHLLAITHTHTHTCRHKILNTFINRLIFDDCY